MYVYMSVATHAFRVFAANFFILAIIGGGYYIWTTQMQGNRARGGRATRK
jgi:hypothetical protein